MNKRAKAIATIIRSVATFNYNTGELSIKGRAQVELALELAYQAGKTDARNASEKETT